MQAMRVNDGEDGSNWVICDSEGMRLLTADDVSNVLRPWQEEIYALEPGETADLGRKFFEVTLQGCSGGFGEFERHPNNGEEYWQDEDELLTAMIEDSSDGGGELMELGVDDLPDDVEDISGRIHDEPYRVFYVTSGYYVGIDYIDPDPHR